jgi:hypothetical protein
MGEKLEFQLLVSMVATAIQCQASSRCKTTPCVSISPYLLWMVGLNSTSGTAQYRALPTVCPQSWQCLRMGPLESQNIINITLLAEGTPVNFLVLGEDIFPLHALTSDCRFTVVYPCFIACDNPLREWLSFTILLQKLHAHIHACLFVLICKLLWHQSCTNFVIPEVLMDDGICRSTADVQLVCYISASDLSVLSNQSINSFNTVHHLWSGQMAQMFFINTCSATLEPFH